MMRALWTAASGMTTQQTNVDTISNNLSNINTIGYKKESAQFKTLLYQTIQDKQTNSDGSPKPLSAQVGLGVRTAAIRSEYTQGSYTQTGNHFDFAIDGDGFYAIQLPNGSIGYTRDGSFQMAIGDNGSLTLATSDGNPVLSMQGQPIVLDKNYSASQLTIDANGYICYPDANENAQSTGTQIGLVQFSNPSGLEKTSNSILLKTEASGEPVYEAGTTLKKSKIKQGYLEHSNVESIDEMVNLIVAQRAYEMNSKIITASDQMLQQANNLRG